MNTLCESAGLLCQGSKRLLHLTSVCASLGLLRARTPTLWAHGCRLPVIDGDDPDKGRFCLLSPEDMQQLRFHCQNDPAIVTGDPDDETGEAVFQIAAYFANGVVVVALLAATMLTTSIREVS